MNPLKHKTLIYDLFYLTFSLVIYGTSLSLTVCLMKDFWSENIFQNVFVCLLGYFLFVHFFIFTIALCRKLVQPKLVEGIFPVGVNKNYLGFVFNSVFHGIFVTAPFMKQVSIVFYLTALYYRLMGMKIGLSNIVGSEVLIRQPELISIGEKTVLGIGAVLSCHYSPDGKSHVQGSIKVGNQSMIGSYSQISPNTVIGTRSVVGNRTTICPGVRIGDNVSIGMSCTILFDAQIPNNVKIKGHTIITKNDNIKSGEIWEGHPAKCVGLLGEKA